MIEHDIDGAMSQLIAEWAIAERRIKRAESYNGNQVVSSAIFELRYAGRKLIDANQMILTGRWRTDPVEKTKILAFLADATEDCVKAKHDAIDAMMLFVATWFEQTERRLKLGKILVYFPDYIQITGMIFDIQDKIADSRGDRMILRDSTYDNIEIDDFEKVLELYRRMKNSEPRVQADIKRQRWKDGFNTWVAIIAAIAAVAAVGYEVWKDFHPEPRPPLPPIVTPSPQRH